MSKQRHKPNLLNDWDVERAARSMTEAHGSLAAAVAEARAQLADQANEPDHVMRRRAIASALRGTQATTPGRRDGAPGEAKPGTRKAPTGGTRRGAHHDAAGRVP